MSEISTPVATVDIAKCNVAWLLDIPDSRQHLTNTFESIRYS